jgi:hypothetical protein
MRIVTATTLVLLGLMALSGAILWERDQADTQDLPAIIPPPEHAPTPGWVHGHGGGL